MSKTATNNQTKRNWNSTATYQKVTEDINGWPRWKKEAYNEMFAVSAHASKVVVSRNK
jgi:hypothetical protein